jgi:hypothetical protein
MEIRNIDVCLESLTIASACNKVLRKRFLKANTKDLIHNGWYSGSVNYSKKALMWLVYRKQTDGCRITYGRNSREYRLPELPNRSVDGFCAETETVYEFLLFLARSHVLSVLRRQYDVRRNTGWEIRTDNGENGKDHADRVSGSGAMGMRI